MQLRLVGRNLAATEEVSESESTARETLRDEVCPSHLSRSMSSAHTKTVNDPIPTSRSVDLSYERKASATYFLPKKDQFLGSILAFSQVDYLLLIQVK